MPKPTPKSTATSDATDPVHATDPELRALSYEQAREELLEVVRALEAGGATLEDSLRLWERGEALAARCQDWLDGARATLDAAAARTAASERAGAAGGPGPDEG